MILPVVIVRYIPDQHCTGCGQAGYCDDKFVMCAGCHNVGLAIFARGKRRRKERELTEVLRSQASLRAYSSWEEIVGTVSRFLRGIRVLQP